MFKKGDKVIYAGDPRKLTGIIDDLEIDSYFGTPTHAWVKFDNWNLIPPRMLIAIVDLEYDNKKPWYASKECDCGLKFCKDGGKHSDWCQMYEKED